MITYREQYWLSIADLREGRSQSREDRVALYRARSEVTRAIDRLALATADPALRTPASAAVWSAIELADIPLGPVTDGRFADEVEAALAERRERSRNAHTVLRNAATVYIQQLSRGARRD
ncbi:MULTISPECIES: hypothetical protein [Streptomyces]|uniref:Uncharacterized protein n=1 Tax=Streptomyces rimosus subsp. rimosus TaxID=132474 RepID=A0ABY3ZE87_STRRM|nr:MULTISPECIES: hypothetical protein [Streptomyces]UNZ08632.1 hypothetical protein SRIMR7_41435 [Streptomyces rimosus subsp. rimosus]UTI00310.1 hypothetical protein SRIMHP_39895 [Streptomyces rimosus subsp. rimosus]UTJ18407.1 hypothetical protein SRIMDV3_39790 [Streptomyces rimosus subsp. rimosus]